ncbi:site-specific DNA-methyltransferase (plasmid) [Streptomyces halstedii]
MSLVVADARRLPLSDRSADVVITSPPYWKKRDYGVSGQLGQEPTADAYASALGECLQEWSRVLVPTGSVMLNVGDTRHRRSLAGIPGRVEALARDTGWVLRNRIVWVKTRGAPDPARDRLADRYEYVLHLTRSRDYYYDLHGYAEKYGNGANPGDVWSIAPERGRSTHVAPFPLELARRAVLLGCPRRVCTVCAAPSRRLVERTSHLDAARPQARRAMEIAEASGLTPEHLAAIRATGISDAGKALRTQDGAGRNSEQVQLLAKQAKAALGGYFREFLMGARVTVGWTDCGHAAMRAGRVLDPFSGTGTTGVAARELGRSYIGADLEIAGHTIARHRTDASVSTVPSTRSAPAGSTCSTSAAAGRGRAQPGPAAEPLRRARAGRW